MGGGSLLTQWIAKYGYVPIVLIGMAGLAPEITREWKSGETIVAKAPVEAESPVEAKAPVVAEAPVERWPPTLETEAEPKARMQLAALDPYVRLLDKSDQPASKGYIMYANSRRIGRPCRCQTRSAPPAPRTTTTYAPRSSRQQCCSMSMCG
jgi:hypothetical protein